MSNIEIQGVSFLSEIISKSDLLVPHFTYNDKTPSWDGFIFVYKVRNKVHKKTDIDETIPVQIKSIEKNILAEKEISFPFEVEDLRNYYQGGGVFLFVVEITPIGNRVFYKPLWCSKLKEILETLKNQDQKTRNIPLHALDPLHLSDFELDCTNFLINRKKQFSTINYPLAVGQATELIVAIPTDPFKNPDYVFSHELGLYGKQYPTDIERFIGPILLGDFTKLVVEPVSINGKKYYSNYKLGRTKDGLYFKFGQEICIDQKELRFKLIGTLPNQLIDLEFLFDFLSSKTVQLGGNTIAIPSINNQDEILRVLNENKKRLDDIKLIFELLNVSPDDHNLDSFDAQSNANLLFLIDYFIYHKSKGTVNISRGFNSIKIGAKHLAIFAIQVSEDNSYYIFNPYRPFSPIGFKFTNEDNSQVIINPFVLIEKDFLMLVDNLDLDMIVEDIKNNETNSIYLELVNLFGLELIKAYDISKDFKFLKAAKTIFYWLLDIDSESSIYLINILQIKRRQTNLTKEEITMLRKKFTLEETIRIKCGLSILLENKFDAEDYFSQLTKDEHDEFINYPIYTLARDLGIFRE